MSSGNAGALQVPLPVNRACAAFALMPQLLVKPVSLRLLKGCILRNMVENNLRGSEVKMSDKINATMATTCAKRLECLGMTPGILGLGEDIWLFRSVSGCIIYVFACRHGIDWLMFQGGLGSLFAAQDFGKSKLVACLCCLCCVVHRTGGPTWRCCSMPPAAWV